MYLAIDETVNKEDDNHIDNTNGANEMDWLNIAVNSYKDLLTFGFQLYGNVDAAIQYANENSTAGHKAKRLALEALGWEIK